MTAEGSSRAAVFGVVRARAPFVAALAALVAHSTALSAGFVWLDHAHLEEGLALAKPAQWGSLFLGGYAGTGFYRPLVSLSLSMDSLLGGSALLYHASTLAWHAAASAMTVVAAGALGLSIEGRLAAGLLFAVHPVTSLVASGIVFRSEAMMAVALLALITFHREGRPTPAAAALFLGALCKETALALAPLFIAALEYGRGGTRDATSRSVLRAEALALAAALSLRVLFAPSWRAVFPVFSGSEALGTRLAALAKSATAIVPIGLWDHTVCDAFPIASVTSPWAIAGALVAFGIVWLARLYRGPCVLFALSLLPSLQIVPVMRWWSPHYLYVPLALLAMTAGALIAPMLRRPLPWVTIVALLFGVQTLRDAGRFRSDDTLWRREVSLHPECREGHFYLAEAHRERKELEQAAAHYALSVRETANVLSFVDLKSALANLGVVRLEQRRYLEARDAFRSAIALSTTDLDRRKFTHNLAAALLLGKDAEGAARALESETGRPDALPESLLIRARALHELGREGEAIALLRRLSTAAQSTEGK